MHKSRSCLNQQLPALTSSTRWHKFHLNDVQPLPWDRPVATFMANNHFFYIDVYR